MDNKSKAIGIGVIALGLALILFVFGVSAAPDEPLPGCSDNPACPKVWYVESWNANTDTGYLVDDLDDPKWRMKAKCNNDPSRYPRVGERYILTGSRLLICDSCSSQDLKAIEIVDKPEKQEYRIYTFWYNRKEAGECTCKCYRACVYKNGVLVGCGDLTENVINSIQAYVNLNASKGDTMNVRVTHCGDAPAVDPYFEFADLTVKCDGKPQVIIEFDPVTGWLVERVDCDDLNGTAACRFTVGAKACPLCRGRWGGTDDPFLRVP